MTDTALTPPTVATATALIEATGLYKSFGPTEALRGIDLTVNRGEVLAVMGPSGSGKSTLLHCIAGVLPPDSGRVVIDGTDVTGLSADARARFRLSKVGFVFQFGQLLPDLSALDNVALPLLMGGMNRRTAAKQAQEWLERLDLADQASKVPGNMSGGQAQRVAIARALVTHPSVVFADEPTGSLDSVAGEKVLRAMLDAVRAAGTTVVLITHDPRTAAYADREVIVRDGRLSGAARGGAA